MSWINLVSTRYLLHQQASDAIAAWENIGSASGRVLLPPLYALISGDQALFRRGMTIARSVMQRTLQQTDRALAQPEALVKLLGLSMLAHVDGIDQTSLWQQIVAARLKTNEMTGALVWLLDRLVGGAPAAGNLALPPAAPPRSERRWLDMIQTTPTRDLFDLAMMPDHPYWMRTLADFVLPLAVLLAKESWESGVMVQIGALLQQGAYPERRQHVVYERRAKRPDWRIDLDPRDPATWFGFDAVELADNAVRVYHWLGLDWQAPLMFQRSKLHAFRSLDHLEQSWQLVQETAPASVWQQIQECRRANRCRHVIVHDQSVSMAMPTHTERAIEHYGVDIVLVDRAQA